MAILCLNLTCNTPASEQMIKTEVKILTKIILEDIFEIKRDEEIP